MVNLFHHTSETCSQVVTEKYSTSFASAIRMLHRDIQKPVYNVYGFVRFADEIVDSFHEFDKALLLEDFKNETFQAIERKISLNPILNSFQKTVNQYQIDLKLVEAFFNSMSQDLHRSSYDAAGYEEYIYGSAEVVGLMCLYIFCEGDKELYEKLKSPAQSLGAAFQKVNFLRDMRADFNGLARIYFPGCDFNNFTDSDKKQIELEVENDFRNAYNGVFELPMKARFGVYVAFKYYYSLFKKIRRMQPSSVLSNRIRIPNYHKAVIIFRAGVKNQLRLI